MLLGMNEIRLGVSVRTWVERGREGVLMRVLKRGEEEEANVSVVSLPFPLYCSYSRGGWFGKGGRDMVRALERGDE